MAVHARLGRRQAGKRRVLNRRVTIAAIDAEMADMVLVAEGNALHVHDTHTGAVRGAGINETGPCAERRDEDRAEEHRPRENVH